jgi:hypothetical protein
MLSIVPRFRAAPGAQLIFDHGQVRGKIERATSAAFVDCGNDADTPAISAGGQARDDRVIRIVFYQAAEWLGIERSRSRGIEGGCRSRSASGILAGGRHAWNE